ncbi:hypothetical protein [Streptomyces lasiicapitis]
MTVDQLILLLLCATVAAYVANKHPSTVAPLTVATAVAAVVTAVILTAQ